MSDPTDYHAICARFSRKPYAWVLWAFEWGKEGPLKDHELEPWQVDVLESIQRQLLEIPDDGDWSCVIREAVSAGHGPGKSTLIAWILLWALTTMKDARVIVSANTEMIAHPHCP